MKTLLVWAIIAVTAISGGSATPIDAGWKGFRMFPESVTTEAVKETVKVLNCYVDVIDRIAKEENVEHLWNPFRPEILAHITELSKCQTEKCRVDGIEVISDVFKDFGLKLADGGHGNAINRINKGFEICVSAKYSGAQIF